MVREMPGSRLADSSNHEEETGVREFYANGIFMRTAEVEAKLDQGKIQEAESSLREGLSLNFEEARALLGRLEYQRGNAEGALRVLDGIDLQAAIQRLQPSLNEKSQGKRGRNQSDSGQPVPQHATMVLEAIYVKAKSLQKLGRFTDAAGECTSILDAVESIFQQGIVDVQVDTKLQETVSRAVALLPELWKQCGCYDKAIKAYRRGLLSQWNLDNDWCARIQKKFAVFLLYSGVEVGPPSLSVEIKGTYIPKNNLEEAILLLMILLRKYSLGKTKWDPSVIEHLTFALSLCNHTCLLAKKLEVLMPGTYHRVDRWNTMALSYSAAGQDSDSLNLLRKSLHRHEKPDSLMALLLAASICSKDHLLAAEGTKYGKRAVSIAKGTNGHLKGVALCMLGLCFGKQAKNSSADYERSHLHSQALKSLEEAIAFEPNNAGVLFELGLQYAEQRNLNAALRYVKKFINATGGSVLKGWRLLALILSAQKRFTEAQVVIDAALDETAKWDQRPLLKIKAKLKVSQALPLEAIETYSYLLALLQAENKAFGSPRSIQQGDEDKMSEFEVWQGLANLYSSLSRWKDVEICLEKARALKQYSAETLHTEGLMYQRQGKLKEAISAYLNALSVNPNYVPCKILLADVFPKINPKTVPASRSLLADALRLEPTNRNAWYHLGMLHKQQGELSDATECFQAAVLLDENDPVENFR